MPIDGLVKAVNLIPSDNRPAARAASGPAAVAPSAGSALGAYVVLAVLVFAVAAAAVYTMASNSIKEKEVELSQVEQDAQAVEAQAASLQTFADFKQLAEARETTVRGIAASRFDWSSALDDLSRALPSDVFISSLDGSTTGAASGSGLRGAIIAPSIELMGCTDDQASVARLMSSLRGIRGVTRVTLAKSEAIETADTAVAPAPLTSAEGEAQAAITEPCPDGSPPSFDMIVFFERAQLTGAAVPNTAAVSTGPTGPAGAVTDATTPPADPALDSTTTTTSTTTP